MLNFNQSNFKTKKKIDKLPLTERKIKDKLNLHSEKLAPFFIEKPDTKAITEGSNDFIEAIVDGNPFPTVAWYKGGIRECLDGPKYHNEVDPSTGIIGLLIKKVKSEDESKYTIKLTNDVGEESTTFSVFVRCNIFNLLQKLSTLINN